MHSKMFDKIKLWYETGKWSKNAVKNAVIKNVITTQEYEEIVGEPYESNN